MMILWWLLILFIFLYHLINIASTPVDVLLNEQLWTSLNNETQWPNNSKQTVELPHTTMFTLTSSMYCSTRWFLGGPPFLNTHNSCFFTEASAAAVLVKDLRAFSRVTLHCDFCNTSDYSDHNVCTTNLLLKTFPQCSKFFLLIINLF